jgi:two-component system, response regulator PdtaR
MNKIKILVCEDEMVIALDLKHTLTNLGFQITSTVTKGEDLIKKYKEDNPDLIITDIKLKGTMDGIEAARIINEIGKVPILFLTGQSDEQTFEQAMETNPCSYLKKPFTETALFEAVTMCVLKK